jgi:hypothetical protein
VKQLRKEKARRAAADNPDLSMHVLVGQVANLRPIGGALWARPSLGGDAALKRRHSRLRLLSAVAV